MSSSLHYMAHFIVSVQRSLICRDQAMILWRIQVSQQTGSCSNKQIQASANTVHCIEKYKVNNLENEKVEKELCPISGQTWTSLLLCQQSSRRNDSRRNNEI